MLKSSESQDINLAGLPFYKEMSLHFYPDGFSKPSVSFLPSRGFTSTRHSGHSLVFRPKKRSSPGHARVRIELVRGWFNTIRHSYYNCKNFSRLFHCSVIKVRAGRPR